MLDTVNDYIEAKLTHSIHTSGAKSFRGCRRRWDWLTRQLYYPRTTAKPLEFGVAFHKAMEVLYDPMLWSKPEEVVTNLAIVTFRRVCEAQYNEYKRSFPSPDLEVVEDYTERKSLGEGMIRHCVQNGRRKDIEAGYRPLLVEVAFEVPIVNPAVQDLERPWVDVLWCKCDNCWDRFCRYVNEEVGPTKLDYRRGIWTGLPVTYGGRIDCIMEGPDGRVWVVDWKTATTLATDREEFLLLDDQVSRYTWAMRYLQYDIAGFLYHELRKAANEEPEPMKVRRLGRLFSTNKQMACTAEVYEATVRENDPGAYAEGLYDDFIQYLREADNRFSARFTVYRNARELDAVGQAIWDETNDMVDPSLRIYPNPGRFNCQNCAFRQPCLEKNSGGDVFYTLSTLFDQREYHYWEKEPLSTDRKTV
jgi:PD-(D/E)XK nuclease superfamily